MKSKINFFFIFVLISFIFIKCGHASLFYPKGEIAVQQQKIIFLSFYTMLIIVLPVILMTIFFAYKYNVKNNNKIYQPDWNHSFKIEFIVWFVPIIIILFLSNIAWKSTHKLDPSNAIISKISPIKIDVISLNKKWLFIYPDQHIATINQLIFPNNTPIIFRVTSNSLMNSFFIPSLGSQIYAMAGMINKLNLIANEPGLYKGFSANYSGVGFSNMKFNVLVTPDNMSFQNWLHNIKNKTININILSKFDKISSSPEDYKMRYFNHVNSHLLDIIVNRFHN
ncbi:ubiquinol oxidase subunit II [Buchnera aphidicola (Mollitrichosiphum nigrofasciatum)]|uniref:ubiquinol oxidase subunit II n=1 Tax=Buchnera aphidicola TaxID=9 RepID=UPI0031B844EA